MCTTLPMTLASTAELAQGPGCIRDYPPITTSSSYHQHHSEMFAVPSSTSLAPYSQAYDLFTSNMPSNYPQTYSSDVQEHGGLDPIPIISCDQATGNPIRFYECGSDSPQHSFVDSPTYHPNGPFHTIKSADPPVKGNDINGMYILCSILHVHYYHRTQASKKNKTTSSC